MEKLQSLLIKYLGENARYTNAQLSSMIGCSEEEVAVAIKSLEDDGTIIKYTTIVNSDKVQGEKVDALIEVKVTPQKMKGFDALAAELCAFEEVQSLYLMSGGFDLAVLISGKNLNDVARFVSEKLSLIDGVVGCATHFLLKKYKIEGKSVTGGINEENRTVV